MKSFTEFLMESKKQYAFRIKLACECSVDQMTVLKSALDKYKVAAMSEPRETPIAETHSNFEHLKNFKVSTIDLLVDYPANPVQIREMIRDALDISEAYIMVMSAGEEANAMPVVPVNDKGALLNQEQMSPADPKAHEAVGDKRVLSLLKELSDERFGGVQYKGVNDEIQVKSAFKEKPAKFNTDLPAGNTSPMGNRKMPNMRTK